jgi:alkanesulfonate monooxygenase SsuD/methylene tetrahydromethanopterin reductase-like flavin-dependent oxidoreductase (luciferase family)
MGPFEIAPGTQFEQGEEFLHGMFPARSEFARFGALGQKKMPQRGDMSARSALTVHRGTANHSEKSRPVLILGVDAPGASPPGLHDMTITREFAESLPPEVRRHIGARVVDRLEPIVQTHLIEASSWARTPEARPPAMRYAVSTPNFGTGLTAAGLGALAASAERAGWDGFFVWDHLFAFEDGPVDVVDPWVALTVAATVTSRIQLGPAVTPLPRRRPHVLARQTASLDVLSGGRLVLGVGTGRSRSSGSTAGSRPTPGSVATCSTRVWSCSPRCGPPSRCATGGRTTA